MSIFGRIKDAIFGHKEATKPAPDATPPPISRMPHEQDTTPQAGTATQAPPQTQAVDVEQVLEAIAREKGNPDLNYKTSIVDLLKLLGIDSILQNRQELATQI